MKTIAGIICIKECTFLVSQLLHSLIPINIKEKHIVLILNECSAPNSFSKAQINPWQVINDLLDE